MGVKAQCSSVDGASQVGATRRRSRGGWRTIPASMAKPPTHTPGPHAAPADEAWTTRKLIAWTAHHLEKKGVDSPRLSAEMLLAHVLQVTRLKLYLDPDRPASPLERAAFRDLVERAAEHHPVQYLVGEGHFFSLALAVDPRVLIPRPSTETLVEHVIQHVRLTPGFAQPLIADVCTGSGAIAISLAKNIAGSRLVATDISEDALAVARANAQRHGVADRIEFRRGSLLEALAGVGPLHFLVTNPPYISDAEWGDVERNVKEYEPALALRGGGDGLEMIRPLLAGAAERLRSPGQLVMELAASQKQAVLDLAAKARGLTNARVLADHEGLPRMLLADRA
jgi:release factor glutamine methyltransferase